MNYDSWITSFPFKIPIFHLMRVSCIFFYRILILITGNPIKQLTVTGKTGKLSKKATQRAKRKHGTNHRYKQTLFF